MEYNFSNIESKWQRFWAENKTFKAHNNSSKEKYYVLDMFPYPSGAGLHVGHPLGYIASDIVARYKRLKGFNVLHPMGYDSFGLPAEQYAIQTGQHPAVTTEKNIARYREQLDKIGFSFDWDREVRTSDPSYYRWTQWIFIKLFHSWYNPETNKAESIDTLIPKLKNFSSLSEKEQSDVLMEHRLAYLSEAMVNWCPQLGTVLANEEVKDGVSERGGYPVERKLMPQWSLRITAYAERLLNDLELIDWTESLKEAQRNWIGKSVGSSLQFAIDNSQLTIEVFTTRPDTVFGATFITLAPEHELVEKITPAGFKKTVDDYVTAAKNRSERERMADVKKVTGVFTGAYVLHPFTGTQIPIWIGDYVLAGYGTGAVMGVPAHDTRDYAFAKHFQLPIIEVVSGGDISKDAYDAKEGTLINSDFLNGLDVKEAVKKIIAEIEKRNLGKGKTNYRLRDANFGRQRYWGEPIPVYYKNNIPHTLPENELPLILPEVDKYLPTETGEPPLARAKDWRYKGEYEYEYTTMPGWAGSSWYFLRYMDAKNPNEFVSKEAVNYWQNVDLYLGGSEHATGHLLYVRFWTKFLNDLGYIPITEPAKKLINQGMIQGISEKILISKFGGNTYRFIDEITKQEYRYHPPDENVLQIVEGNADIVFDIYKANTKKSSVSFEDFKLSYYTKNIAIDIVKNSKASLKDVLTSIPDLKNAVFVFKDGIYHLGRFFKYGTSLNLLEGRNQITQSDFENFDGELLVTTFSEVEKMSKSKYNVVTPDDIVSDYGADCLRLYEMFLGPLEQSKPWNTNGISGVSNFIRKLWRLFHHQTNSNNFEQAQTFYVADEPASKSELKTLHKTIKKATEDIERYSFNTSVSTFMICVNELTDLKCNKREILQPLLILIAPYAPHIAEELWQKLGHNESITYATWPEFKEEFLVEDSYEYPVSINGKTRFKIPLSLQLSKEQVEQEVLSTDELKKYTNGNSPKKVIVVPGRIVNVVV